MSIEMEDIKELMATHAEIELGIALSEEFMIKVSHREDEINTNVMIGILAEIMENFHKEIGKERTQEVILLATNLSLELSKDRDE